MAKHLLLIALILLISNACILQKKWAYTEIGDAYYSEFDCQKQGVDIYRSSITNKKLHGRIIRTNTGMYDSTLHFELISTFHRGRLNGIDYVFRGDQEIARKNYVLGVQQGKEVIYDDSLKIVSNYVDGVIHGTQSTYINDWVVKRSHFSHGVKDSLEFYYDSLGELATIINYRFYDDSFWYDNLYLKEHQLVSISNFEILDPKWLKNAQYKGTITYYSHDPKGIANPLPWKVVDESILNDDACDQKYEDAEYFYVINDNDCVFCDYIDFDGIWFAYVGIHGSYGLEGLRKVEWFQLE